MPNSSDKPEYEGNRIAHPSAAEITGILVRWSQGDEHALDSLTPLVYRDLRRIAARLLRDERSGHTLQPTALVNEAYLKLAGQPKRNGRIAHIFLLSLPGRCDRFWWTMLVGICERNVVVAQAW